MTKQDIIDLAVEKVTEIIEAMDDQQEDHDDTFQAAQEHAQQLLDELESIDHNE